MIARILSAFTLACMVPAMVMYGEQKTRSPRQEPMVVPQKQEAWLTQSQAQHILTAVDMLVRQMQEFTRQNKAPRPGAQPCDPAFPACCNNDLSAILAELCCIQLQLQCICANTASIQEELASCCEEIASIADVVGECTDTSVLLGTQADKSCIDALCLSVVSLLKTVLLELRGGFTGPFPCDVTP